MRVRLALLALIAGIAAWLYLREAAPPSSLPETAARPGPSGAVLGRLARGVNLSNWLQHGRATEAARYAPDRDDFRRIRALGFGHVRLPVDPAALVNDRALPDPKAIAQLRGAIEAAQAEGLLVVLTLQLPSRHKAGLQARDTDRAALAGLWRWLAGALADLPRGKLVFEPLNEPEFDNAAASRALMAELAAAIRAAAPDHTVAVSGHKYASVAALEALRPLDDSNTVYTFHFYEPHNFTHQGANWGDPGWRALSNLPYPSSPERVAPLLGQVPQAARNRVRWHGEERWNRERITALITRAAAWGRAHGVPVWCGEFGALKTRSRPEHRAAWLRDVREQLEHEGIGWTHWDYAGDFGIVRGLRGARVEDKVTLDALGLK
jgi:hypothetical protein